MIVEEKQRLREKIRASLAELSEAQQASASATMRNFLSGWDHWKQASRICAFAPSRIEPSWIPSDLSGKTLAFPKVEGSTMKMIPVEGLEDLRPGFYGILEPPVGEGVVISDFDLVVVPGLAFDHRGGRLGRGGGFYDRFLAGCPVFRLGVGFGLQFLENIPTEWYDERVDGVLTENGITVF